MTEYKHLKNRIYYSDLYDRFTVEECRGMEERIKNMDWSKHADKGFKLKDKTVAAGMLSNLSIYMLSGERYEHKNETIEKWMARDRAMDEKLEKSVAPTGVTCLKCGSTMHLESKDLFDRDDQYRVLFMFRCNSGCKRGRAFYDNGDEYVRQPTLCPKCNSPMEASHQKKPKSLTTTYTCTKCGHSYSDTMDFGEKKETPDPNYEADRNRFCFDEKRGGEFLSFKLNMGQFKNIMAEIDERDKNKEVYEAVAKIKKLPIAEVQKLLTEALEKEGYTNLQFQQPELGKDVIVPFTAMEGKPDRGEYDSKQQLKKLVEKTLGGSNWKLMSDGITYRVGYVSGRLKCLEREEDLKKLVTPQTPD